MKRLSTALLTLLLLACGPKRRIEHLTLEPVVVKVDGEEVVAETPDPELDRLGQLVENGDCAAAIPALERFVEDFRESSRWGEAIYRLAQCEEIAGDEDIDADNRARRIHLERAHGYYFFLRERTRRDVREQAALRSAFALETLERYSDAAAEYAVAASYRDTAAEAIAGATLRRAICLFRGDEEREALRALERGMNMFNAVPSPSDNARTTAAEARFLRAEKIAERFDAVTLEYPAGRLKKRFVKKARVLREARDAYAEAIALKDPEWTAASVYRMGELSEHFAGQLVALHQDAGAKPFTQQAFDEYQRVSTLGERVGLESPWVEKARARIKVLEPELRKGVLQ